MYGITTRRWAVLVASDRKAAELERAIDSLQKSEVPNGATWERVVVEKRYRVAEAAGGAGDARQGTLNPVCGTLLQRQ